MYIETVHNNNVQDINKYVIRLIDFVRYYYNNNVQS